MSPGPSTDEAQRGREHLDRLARQGAADGGWITPPINPRPSATWIAVVVLLSLAAWCFLTALFAAIWVALP